MPEMLTPTSAIMGAGLGKDVALITDGRFSGGSHGFLVGHIRPEAQGVALWLWCEMANSESGGNFGPARVGGEAGERPIRTVPGGSF
jgi:hypothetical protein